MENKGLQEIIKTIERMAEEMQLKIDSDNEQTITETDKNSNEVKSALQIRESENINIEKKLEQLERNFKDLRVELLETQEAVDYLLSRNIQLEKKLRTLMNKD